MFLIASWADFTVRFATAHVKSTRVRFISICELKERTIASTFERFPSLEAHFMCAGKVKMYLVGAE